MIPIKFRARNIDSGEFVFAELGQVSAEINPDYLTVINDEGIYTIDADTLSQLAGYDMDGREVYAGDVEIDKQGNEYVAQLRPCVVRKTPLGEDIHFDVDKFTLKEETP